MGEQNLFEINWSTACKKYGGCKHLTLEFFLGGDIRAQEWGGCRHMTQKLWKTATPPSGHFWHALLSVKNQLNTWSIIYKKVLPTQMVKKHHKSYGH